MPALKNPRHEKIVQALHKGKSKVDAYVEGGFKPNRGNATKFFDRPDIKKRFEEIGDLKEKRFLQEVEVSADVAKRLGITKEKVLTALWLNASACLRGAPILDKDGKPTGEYNGIPSNPAAANQALKLIGLECHGMFVEKLEVGNPGDFARLTDVELRARVEADAQALGMDGEATEALLLTFQPKEDEESK